MASDFAVAWSVPFVDVFFLIVFSILVIGFAVVGGLAAALVGGWISRFIDRHRAPVGQ